MLPTINGKDIIDCELSDLQIILDNPTFAENEYLDYKKSFAIDVVARERKQQEQVELRNDVCSFANSKGGYLFFGIKEERGIPKEIVGITIENNNTDLFEINLKNHLQTIQPRVPYYRIKFIKVPADKFVVVLYIQHDFFAPYIHIEEQKNYKIYKRMGNAKIQIEYQELKNMFTQSITFEREISIFRQERVGYYQSLGNNNTYTRFSLFHIIPDTFLDSEFDLPVYIINQKDRSIEQIFYSYECDTFAIPMIRGLRCRGRGVNAECRLFNNGIAEFFYPLEKYLYTASSRYQNDEVFDWTCIWNKIEPAVNAYIDKLQKQIKASKLYMCISIVGAQKALTPSEEGTRDRERMGDIDRDYLICEPIEFSLENECKSGSLNMKRFKLCYLLSLGIRESKEVDQLINEVYS